MFCGEWGQDVTTDLGSETTALMPAIIMGGNQSSSTGRGACQPACETQCGWISWVNFDLCLASAGKEYNTGTICTSQSQKQVLKGPMSGFLFKKSTEAYLILCVIRSHVFKLYALALFQRKGVVKLQWEV